MTAIGDAQVDARIDDSAARAGQVPEGEGGVSLTRRRSGGCAATRWRSSARSSCVLFVLVALFAPLLAPHDPLRADAARARSGRTSSPGPAEGFPLGVDHLGRDVLSRLIFGCPPVAAGRRGRRRCSGSSSGMALGVPGRARSAAGSTPCSCGSSTCCCRSRACCWRSASRCCSGQSQYHGDDRGRDRQGADLRPAAARLDARPARAATTCSRRRRSGVQRRRIVLSHVLPNSLGPVIVQATLTLATAIIEAAALSFLGLGDPDLGPARVGGDARRRAGLPSIRPALAFYPALAHHHRRARLHPARRVAARGPRPEVPEVSPDELRAGGPSGTPVLEVEDLAVTFDRRGEQRDAGGRRRQLRRRAGRDGRPGRASPAAASR